MSVLPAMAAWQRRGYDQAVAALQAGHLGHALLVCGPAYIGKRLVAEHLARRLLCLQPGSDGLACGACRSCRLLDARAQREPAETRPDGSLAHPFGHASHPDLLLAGHAWNDKASPPRMRSEIVIEQVRALSEKLGLTPQLGGAQVVIVDPADAVNWNAFNALLKTLEEPQPGRHLLLLASAPARLPATIRSRCQRLELRLPTQEEALAWLRARGHADARARAALDAARGHPGQADAWLAGDGLDLREAVARDLQQLQSGRAGLGELAQRWSADGRAGERLSHLAELARIQAAADLTDAAAGRRLAARFDAANRNRALLRSTVRADLVVAEALQAWRGDPAPHDAGRRR